MSTRSFAYEVVFLAHEMMCTCTTLKEVISAENLLADALPQPANQLSFAALNHSRLSAGEFAEAVRDQFLNERIEYYKELEDAIANAAATDGMETCTREHVKAGLLHLDPDMADHVVSSILQNTGLFSNTVIYACPVHKELDTCRSTKILGHSC